MKVALIGRGRVATHLIEAVRQAGHEVVSVNSRTLEELPERADIYVIAVKDSALQDVVRQATKGRDDQLFVHTAGSMALGVFEGCCRHYGVLYPMQTFSKEQPVDFREIPLFVEATDAETLIKIRSFAESLSAAICIWRQSSPAISSTTAMRWPLTCWRRRDCPSTSCCR